MPIETNTHTREHNMRNAQANACLLFAAFAIAANARYCAAVVSFKLADAGDKAASRCLVAGLAASPAGMKCCYQLSPLLVCLAQRLNLILTFN